MEKEDWMHVGMVAGGAVLGLAARVFLKSDVMKKAMVSTTAAAMRAHRCVEESTASLQAQADDIAAAAREKTQSGKLKK
jgi:hypothetical protein